MNIGVRRTRSSTMPLTTALVVDAADGATRCRVVSIPRMQPTPGDRGFRTRTDLTRPGIEVVRLDRLLEPGQVGRERGRNPTFQNPDHEARRPGPPRLAKTVNEDRRHDHCRDAREGTTRKRTGSTPIVRNARRPPPLIFIVPISAANAEPGPGRQHDRRHQRTELADEREADQVRQAIEIPAVVAQRLGGLEADESVPNKPETSKIDRQPSSLRRSARSRRASLPSARALGLSAAHARSRRVDRADGSQSDRQGGPARHRSQCPLADRPRASIDLGGTSAPVFRRFAPVAAGRNTGAYSSGKLTSSNVAVQRVQMPLARGRGASSRRSNRNTKPPAASTVTRAADGSCGRRQRAGPLPELDAISVAVSRPDSSSS